MTSDRQQTSDEWTAMAKQRGQRAKLEQVAREWLHAQCLLPGGMKGYDWQREIALTQSLANLLASRDVAVLEEVERRFACTAGLVQWCKQQAKERRA